MLVRFMSCRERFRLKYVMGLEPADKWVKTFGYGNMWHVCEEAHAKGIKEWVNLLQVHTGQMMKRYRPQEEEIVKWFEVCRVQFPEYVKYWSEHPDVKNRTPLMQEQVFDVPYCLPSGRVVRLRGKFDSVDLITEECICGAVKNHEPFCREGETGIYLQENKTKGDIDQLQVERQLKFDLQTCLYLVALREDKDAINIANHLSPNKPDIKGVRYNVVRRPLSGGVGNIRPHAAKATKTKVTPAETADEFYKRLRNDYIAADPGYWFFRVRSEVTPDDIRVFQETCLNSLLEQVCWWYDEIRDEGNNNDGYRSAAMHDYGFPPMNYRTPFGVYSALEEGGATEYDAYLQSGSEAGLRRVEEMFTELQQ